MNKAESELQWVNHAKVIHPKTSKPCKELGYCPYGQMVEIYPFSESVLSCTTKNGAIIQFGHDCPAHYLAEFVK